MSSPAAVSAVRPDGHRWTGAWFVVRRAGVPVALVEAGFDGADELPADRVRGLVDTAASGAPQRPARSVPDGDLPSASVVVPTNLARPEQLRVSLSALDQLDYPDAEVLLVDNSRDSPPRSCAGSPRGCTGCAWCGSRCPASPLRATPGW